MAAARISANAADIIASKSFFIVFLEEEWFEARMGCDCQQCDPSFASLSGQRSAFCGETDQNVNAFPNVLRRREQSLQRLKAFLFLKSAEPGIGKDVARTVGRPARRIHFAVRFHDRVVIVDFAAPLPEVTNQFLARVELRARRLVAIEIADQTNAEADVVEIVAVHVAAVDLPPPAVTHFDLTIAGRCPVADHEMISESILHSADVPMVIIEHGGVPLSCAAVVDDDVLPASTCNRGTIDCRSHRCCEISITSPTTAVTSAEKARPKTARLLITIFFDR